ncbi:MAG TPA: hypothetical protein VFI91_08700 [Longimicrobiaceae bacterium]|nr:hypothetical protein [Longimicrobiaceae bacterium]
MSTALGIISTALLLSFVICCVVSALLQILAWSRHAREGAPVSLRALWKPEGHFDEVGLHQIRLARRMLTLGGVAYLSYGVILVVTSILTN